MAAFPIGSNSGGQLAGGLFLVDEVGGNQALTDSQVSEAVLGSTFFCSEGAGQLGIAIVDLVRFMMIPIGLVEESLNCSSENRFTKEFVKKVEKFS